MNRVGPSNLMRFFTLFLGIGFSIGGALWVFQARQYLQLARRSVEWVKVPGVVTQTSVLLADDSYRPNIEYRYEVGGQCYTGESLTLGAPFSSSEKWAKEIAGRYPAGSKVLVAVNPISPSSSVLEPGVRWHMYLFLSAGAAMAILGIVVLYLDATH
jgi:hypothetical protein